MKSIIPKYDFEKPSPVGGAQIAGGNCSALTEARAETGGFCVAKLG